MRAPTILLVISALALAGCTDPVPAPATTTLPPTTTSAPTTTTTTLADCSSIDHPAPSTIDGDTAAELSMAVSRIRYECANEAVVTADTATAISAGTALGIAADQPVLVNGAGVVEELDRLGVLAVRWVGSAPAPDLGVPVTVVSPAAVSEPLPPPIERADVTWVLGSSSEAASLVAATAAARGEAFVDVSGIADLRVADSGTILALQPGSVVAVGLDDGQLWQLAAIRGGAELAGGGYTFDGKRLVAFYGNPTTSALGVLGEQGPAATLERIEPLLEEYASDGLRTVPVFEIIATVASARAGADDDYSDEAGVETLRPWIDFAGENGVYVVLDLQPGRAHFLDQARRYEEFLRLPHVGLALDPEWRLGPDQVHLRQIGTVDAAEINEVSRWLAQIVREENLPQKYFMIHQFRFSMITNREQIETPLELFTVIHMDGQGPLPSKFETYRAITAGQDHVGWAWGWKNFYDEDSPMATPADVLGVEPIVVYVSYQ